MNRVVHQSWLDVLADPLRVEILAALGEQAEATATELARATHASDPSLRKHLEAMVAAGVVRERKGASDGLTPGRPATRFSLPPPVRESARTLFTVLAQPLGSAPRRTPEPHSSR